MSFSEHFYTINVNTCINKDRSRSQSDKWAFWTRVYCKTIGHAPESQRPPILSDVLSLVFCCSTCVVCCLFTTFHFYLLLKTRWPIVSILSFEASLGLEESKWRSLWPYHPWDLVVGPDSQKGNIFCFRHFPTKLNRLWILSLVFKNVSIHCAISCSVKLKPTRSVILG